METKPLGNADVDNSNESISVTNPSTYHESVCGSILYCAPTNSTSEIFSYIHHGRFDAFRRSLEIYYKDIVQMKNEHGQVNKNMCLVSIRLYYFRLSYKY